jgi:hypothetical protein
MINSEPWRKGISNILKRTILNVMLVCGPWALGACAGRSVTYQPGVDLSKMKRVSVAPFDGPGGKEAADEFVRKLLAAGLEVSDVRHPGDLVLSGTVTDYKPTNTLMVFVGDTTLVGAGGQTIVVNDPVLSAGASQTMPEGAVMGGQNPQMASVHSVAGAAARLVEASSGRPVWSGSFTYESLDIQAALQAVIEALTQSMSRVLPQMSKKPI